MSGDKGFTYPAALLMIVVISTSLVGAQKYWSTIITREVEKELLFRGEQIHRAIGSYYNASPGNSPEYPKSFGNLLKDNRFPVTIRHLRKAFTDPVTKGPWGLVYDGKGGIKGVYSNSDKPPVKTGNFEKDFSSFERKTKYSDWKFIFEPSAKG